MNLERLNAYHIMWVFVFFDLPVVAKYQRRKAAYFRKGLEKSGFNMMQYSVYTRHCASRESAEVYVNRVKSMVPAEGHVSVLQITDKQYGNIINFWGAKTTRLPPGPRQLELF